MLDWIQNIVGGIGESLLKCLSFVYDLLPDSPFKLIDNSSVDTWLGGLNWIFPIAQIISILEAWLACIVVYYGYQLILRWTRAIK